MNLKNHTDSQGNYYEFSEVKNSPMTIFIHGVGLDNTMWYPQKEYFINQSVLFYDLLNHGKSTGGYKELSFKIYSKQLLNIINELQLEKINIVKTDKFIVLFKFKTVEATIAGTINKIAKGFVIPPVKYNNKDN